MWRLAEPPGEGNTICVPENMWGPPVASPPSMLPPTLFPLPAPSPATPPPTAPPAAPLSRAAVFSVDTAPQACVLVGGTPQGSA